MYMTAEVLDLRQRYEAGALILFSELAEAEENLDGAQYFYGLVTVATAIASLLWIYRASRNLHSLGALGQRFSPGWAVGWWFIPIFFFFRPYQVMVEIWKGSTPRASGETTLDWKSGAVSALLPWWWACWIAQWFIGLISGITEASGGSIEVALLGDAINICWAVLSIALVWQTTKRQDEKHQNMNSGSTWPL